MVHGISTHIYSRMVLSQTDNFTYINGLVFCIAPFSYDVIQFCTVHFVYSFALFYKFPFPSSHVVLRNCYVLQSVKCLVVVLSLVVCMLHTSLIVYSSHEKFGRLYRIYPYLIIIINITLVH